MRLGKRLRVGAWLPTAAWAAGAGVLAAFAATAAAAGVGSLLPADLEWDIAPLVVMLASVYAAPLAAVVAVGRKFRWWQAVLLCHGAAVASFAALLFLAADWPGVATGAVAASGWTAAGLAAGTCCAARSWATRPRLAAS